MNDSKDGWTAEELVAELRARARESAAEGLRSGAGAPKRRSADLGGLASVSTAELAQLAKDRQRAIYGVDDRKDLYQVTNAKVKAAASAVVALVEANDLTKRPDGSYDLATDSYRDTYRLCSSEPFVDQPLGCFCSGFLVAPDVVATAGHCVKGAAQLAQMRFVFDFRMVDGATPRTRFPDDDVYSGVSVIGRALDNATGTDWALVRLDRKVVGRQPVKVRTSGKVPAGQKLFVIGHPCGLPQKYAPGAEVRDNAPGPYFVANLDTYGGNSGSPVFNAADYRVEGILVRGEQDFVTSGSCNVSLVCPTTGCRGEDVTRSVVWSAKVPAAKAASVRKPARGEAKKKVGPRMKRKAGTKAKRSLR